MTHRISQIVASSLPRPYGQGLINQVGVMGLMKSQTLILQLPRPYGNGLVSQRDWV